MSSEKAFATVKRVEHDAVVVESDQILCRRCEEGRGCGAGLLAAGRRGRRLELARTPGLELRPGDRVEVRLPSDQLLASALRVYGLPLAGLLGGAALASVAGAGGATDTLAFGLGLAGLLAGTCAGAYAARRDGCTPVLHAVPGAQEASSE